MKKTTSILAMIFLSAALQASVNAAPEKVHEGSWHWVDDDLIRDDDGYAVSDTISTLDVTLVVFEKVVCGSYDGALGLRQPKSSSFDFIGFQSNGVAHVYFPNTFSGVPDDNGAANVDQKGATLRWAITQEPKTEDYLFTNETLAPIHSDRKEIKRLKEKCSAIARSFGDVNAQNAHRAVARFNAY